MRTSPLALLLVSAALLAGCTPVPAPPAGPPSETPTPVETVEPAPALDPDVLLVVSAVATADSGAVLNLTMTVHKATAWNDPSAPDRPALMTSGCDGSLEESVYQANLWSFVKIDVEAVDAGATPWTDDKHLRLFPIHNDDVVLASNGFLVWDEDVDQDTPYCVRERHIYGEGSGTLIAGIQGDTDEVAAAGNFTRWANQLYGFVGREVAGQSAASAGITISGCTFTLTDAGKELNGGADWWGEKSDESDCYAGAL